MEQPHQEDNEECNLLFERMKQFIDNSTIVPFMVYSADNLKMSDGEKVLINEDMNNIKYICNILRNHYVEQVNEETKNFIEKYNLKEKLKFKSEVFIYEILLKELGISTQDLEEIEEINNLENDESAILKYYLNKYTKNRNEELKKENEKLREELRILREKNNLEL